MCSVFSLHSSACVAITTGTNHRLQAGAFSLLSSHVSTQRRLGRAHGYLCECKQCLWGTCSGESIPRPPCTQPCILVSGVTEPASYVVTVVSIRKFDALWLALEPHPASTASLRMFPLNPEDSSLHMTTSFKLERAACIFIMFRRPSSRADIPTHGSRSSVRPLVSASWFGPEPGLCPVRAPVTRPTTHQST